MHTNNSFYLIPLDTNPILALTQNKLSPNELAQNLSQRTKVDTQCVPSGHIRLSQLNRKENQLVFYITNSSARL